MKKTRFERAIFLSWYCSKGDCAFCYMSTQKNLIREARKARRKKESVLAEALICKLVNWKIEFLSGGYESYSFNELLDIVKKIYQITGQKQWLNVGVLNEKELKAMKPYIEGFCGAVECINPKIHDKVCPSKPIAPIVKTFKICNKLNLKKAMTIIIGIGEKEKDIPLLVDFIKKNRLDRITFYALNPHKGTPFNKGPETEYYVKWIKETRKNFPRIEIIAGSWVNRLEEIHELLDAGADSFTKFPSIKLFNSRYAKQIEKEVKKSGRKLESYMTKLPRINIEKEVKKLPFDDDLKEKIKKKVEQYLKMMRKNK